MKYYMWKKHQGGWFKNTDGSIRYVDEETYQDIARRHMWTQVEFVPESEVDTFERNKRAIASYYGGYNYGD